MDVIDADRVWKNQNAHMDRREPRLPIPDFGMPGLNVSFTYLLTSQVIQCFQLKTLTIGIPVSAANLDLSLIASSNPISPSMIAHKSSPVMAIRLVGLPLENASRPSLVKPL